MAVAAEGAGRGRVRREGDSGRAATGGRQREGVSSWRRSPLCRARSAEFREGFVRRGVSSLPSLSPRPCPLLFLSARASSLTWSGACFGTSHLRATNCQSCAEKSAACPLPLCAAWMRLAVECSSTNRSRLWPATLTVRVASAAPAGCTMVTPLRLPWAAQKERMRATKGPFSASKAVTAFHAASLPAK